MKSTDQWDRVYRVAVCAAAEAIAARNWSAKRQALDLAKEADAARCVVSAAVFGAAPVPAQYAELVDMGAGITREQTKAAWAVIRGDRK